MIDSANTYTLNPLCQRRDQPVVIGISWAFEGGDLWQAAEPIKGHEGNYVDVYNYINADFQIYVEFAEKGFNLDVKIINPDGSVDYSEGNIKAIAQWNKALKDFYDSGENLPLESNVTMTFMVANQCIPTINLVTNNTVLAPGASGTVLEENTSTINNALLYPLALGESIVLGESNNEFTSNNEQFKNLHKNFGNPNFSPTRDQKHLIH